MKRTTTDFVKSITNVEGNVFANTPVLLENGSVDPTVLAIVQEAYAQLEIMSRIVEDFKSVIKADVLASGGTKKFKNDVFTTSYAAATTQDTVDKKKLKEKYPAVFADTEVVKTKDKAAVVSVNFK